MSENKGNAQNQKNIFLTNIKRLSLPKKHEKNSGTKTAIFNNLTKK